MGDTVFLGLSLVVGTVFLVAYLHRVRHLPLSERGHDMRARIYGASIFAAILPYDVFKLVEDILAVLPRR